MADHMREQVMDAMLTTIGTLTSIGAPASRNRIYAEQAPALAVMMGDDVPIQDDGRIVVGAVDRRLVVNLVVIAQATDPQDIDQQLNAIEAELYNALQSLSLPGIQRHHWAGTSEPETSQDFEIPTATMTVAWVVEYRHQLTDVTAPGA